MPRATYPEDPYGKIKKSKRKRKLRRLKNKNKKLNNI
jgi:hypothetical protein